MSTKEKKLNGTVIVTYRCNARCTMCNRYKVPSDKDREISIETIKKLPPMYFTNITGGEPFLRDDLKDIVRELYKKSDRIVISTNGYFTDKIVDLAKEFPQIGIRVSIEGTQKTNDAIRGIKNGYERGLDTLQKLKAMGLKDIGFGMVIQDKNADDILPLYEISEKMDMEFATATLHNSFYFVENNNIINDRQYVAKNTELLINRLLKSNSPKKWFRAYFNHGLINYMYSQPRLLPCDMSFDTFFIDPYGDVMPCNGTEKKMVMGNLNNKSWDEVWNSVEAEKIRTFVRRCDRQCWMIGSVSPAMHKYIWKPALWVLKHKARSLFTQKPYSMYENEICQKLKDGTVTKEELDACSTCAKYKNCEEKIPQPKSEAEENKDIEQETENNLEEQSNTVEQTEGEEIKNEETENIVKTISETTEIAEETNEKTEDEESVSETENQEEADNNPAENKECEENVEKKSENNKESKEKLDKEARESVQNIIKILNDVKNRDFLEQDVDNFDKSNEPISNIIKKAENDNTE